MAKKYKTPPDIDGRNGLHASWAEATLTTYQKLVGGDRIDALADLLGDLMHWADRNERDIREDSIEGETPFETALDRAQFHYNAETGVEPY